MQHSPRVVQLLLPLPALQTYQGGSASIASALQSQLPFPPPPAVLERPNKPKAASPKARPKATGKDQGRQLLVLQRQERLQESHAFSRHRLCQRLAHLPQVQGQSLHSELPSASSGKDAVT